MQLQRRVLSISAQAVAGSAGLHVGGLSTSEMGIALSAMPDVNQQLC